MKSFLLREGVLLGLIALCASANAQSNPLPTNQALEAYVREYYARLTFLTEIDTVSDAAATNLAASTVIDSANLGNRVKARAATFALSQLRAGNLADIANEPWVSVVTPPTQLTTILETDLGLQSYSEPDSGSTAWFTARAHWTTVNLTNLDLTATVGSWSVGTAVATAGPGMPTARCTTSSCSSERADVLRTMPPLIAGSRGVGA